MPLYGFEIPGRQTIVRPTTLPITSVVRWGVAVDPGDTAIRAAAQRLAAQLYHCGRSGPIPGGSSLKILEATNPIMAMIANSAVQSAAIRQAVPKMKNALA
jgi:hypothetical protein